MRLRYDAKAKLFLAENQDLVILEPKNYKNNWSKTVFMNNNPCFLEIGCGKGEFIIAMAVQYPEINFIALDKYEVILRAAVKKLKKLLVPVKNLKFVKADANHILNFFAKNEIAQLYLNFSDPWPKNRYAKRRLSHPLFLEKYAIILQKKAMLALRTDNLNLFNFSLSSLKTAAWTIINYEKEALSAAIVTEYETKFRQENKPIYCLTTTKKNLL